MSLVLPLYKTIRSWIFTYDSLVFRVLESYKRMREPRLQVVDADGTPDEVLQTVIHLLQSKGLFQV